jgi:hypothetical protein
MICMVRSFTLVAADTGEHLSPVTMSEFANDRNPHAIIPHAKKS